jgi:ribosomal protein S18 acetylase RimI-like enzyme
MLTGGFFAGWRNAPSADKHFEILSNSDYIVLAVEDHRKVVGFINAVSDKTLSAYVPLLEVLPEYQKQGIGRELVRMMLEILKDFYMVDLCCDETIVSFYQKFKMTRTCGMIIRNYNKQQGI